MKKYKEIKNDKKTTFPPQNLTIEERLDIFANFMIDRILEEEERYKEKLKTDPKVKRIYEK